MSSHQVHLDVFEGPLDLLLYLIRKDDISIYDIPVSKITSEYLGYIDLMKELRLDIAGEFLVMASTLMQIKAKMLLPAPPKEGEEEGPDPRAELVNRLLEYQRFKEVSHTLQDRLHTHRDVHYKGAPIFTDSDYSFNVSLFDLLDAFRDVLKELKPEVREIMYEEVPIEVKVREILSFLEGRSYATFLEILRQETTRQGLIVTFLAILELIRLKQIVARQTDLFSEIRVYRVTESEQAPAEEAPAPADEEATPAPPMPDPKGESDNEGK